MNRQVGTVLPVLLVLLAAAPAAAFDRKQVFSIQGAESADAGELIRKELDRLPGVKKADFDRRKVEVAVKLADSVPDAAVLAAVERTGLKAVVGPGQGAYRPLPDYPPGADVMKLTNDGSRVGPLEKLRVPGKYTVFDVYADWCGPCRQIDEALRTIVAQREDVAVRKLNVIDFDSPLARELGSRFEGLPFLVVFGPTGKRTFINGASTAKLELALRQP